MQFDFEPIAFDFDTARFEFDQAALQNFTFDFGGIQTMTEKKADYDAGTTPAPEKKEPPEFWGMSTAKFYRKAEGETLTLHLVTSETLQGELIGAGRYDLVLLVDDERRVLVPKGAITWAEILKGE